MTTTDPRLPAIIMDAVAASTSGFTHHNPAKFLEVLRDYGYEVRPIARPPQAKAKQPKETQNA